MTCSCGYDHLWTLGIVRFICRYRDMTDYCVNGVRVKVQDGGTVQGTAEDVETLRAWLLREADDFREDFAKRCPDIDTADQYAEAVARAHALRVREVTA